MKATNTELIKHWIDIRANAIEIGILAERQLIAVGYLSAEDRRILSRAEARQQPEPAQIDNHPRFMVR